MARPGDRRGAVRHPRPGPGPAQGDAGLCAVPGEEPGDPRLGQVGQPTVTWKDGGKAFEYRKDGKTYRYDVAARKAEEVKPGDAPSPGRRGGVAGAAGAGRGQQLDSAPSPDGTLKAFYRDRNLWVGDPNGLIEMAVTTDGSREGPDQERQGELGLRRGAGPEHRLLVVARRQEARLLSVRREQGRRLLPPARPDQGPGPARRRALPQGGLAQPDRRAVRLRPEGEEDDQGRRPRRQAVRRRRGRPLRLQRRAGRRTAGSCCSTGPTAARTSWNWPPPTPRPARCRVVVREEWPASWVENNPEIRFLEDGRRFLWATSRNGWKNYDLYDLDGKRLAAVTRNEFDADQIVRVDEKAGVLYYFAHDGDNPMKLQLHRAKLDGTGRPPADRPGVPPRGRRRPRRRPLHRRRRGPRHPADDPAGRRRGQGPRRPWWRATSRSSTRWA